MFNFKFLILLVLYMGGNSAEADFVTCDSAGISKYKTDREAAVAHCSEYNILNSTSVFKGLAPNGGYLCEVTYSNPITFEVSINTYAFSIEGAVSCSPALVDLDLLGNTQQECSTRPGSIIEPSNQILGEIIPLGGASFSLNYFSDNVIGRKDNYKVKFPITGTEVAPETSSFQVKAFTEQDTLIETVDFDNSLNQSYEYVWDGKENNVEAWASVWRKFILTQNTSIIDMVLPTKNIPVGTLKAKKLGIGGWVPSNWHFYDSKAKLLYLGNGSTRKVDAVSDGTLKRVASESGSEVYYFDSVGKIVKTRTGLTGAVVFTFEYDSEGRLLTISEPFNRVTTFSRYLNGNLKAIIAPNNIKTSITINSAGYIAKATGLNLESFEMTYTDTGLLLSFKKPNGLISNMVYDIDGNLVSDLHVSGFKTDLSKTLFGITSTSAMGRKSTNKFDKKLNFEMSIEPSGFSHNYFNTAISSTYQTMINNRSTIFGNDPRFGNQVKVPVTFNSLNFGTRYTTFSRVVETNSPTSNPFTFNTLTEVTKNGDSEITSVYNASTKTNETTTTLGKTSSVQFDEYERPIHSKIGNMVTKDFVYTNNLLTLMTEGTRKLVLSYYPNNLLKSIRDTLGQVTTYTYDDSQRLSSKTLPDSRVINYSYDSAGNLTSITTPNNKLHQFTIGNNEKLNSYGPPPLNNGATLTPTSYTYNIDRQLKLINRPDGKIVTFNYNAITALLESISGDFGIVNYGYSFNRPNNISYDGIHMSVDHLGDVVSGYTVTVPEDDFTLYTYSRTPVENAGGKVASEKVHGGGDNSAEQTINYSYDEDEYLKNAGEMELNYNTPNGQLESTKLGSVRDYYYYNSFGEVRAYKAKFQSDEIYSYELERDSIGRIIKKTETLNNVTSVFEFVFDVAGRLVQVKTNGVVSSTYNYDLNSNRIGGAIRGENTLASYDDQDRLVTYNNYSYGYSLNGNRSYKRLTINSTPETSFNTFYDSLGNLTKVENGINTINYDLDPNLRRLGRNYNETEKQGYIYNPEGKLIGEMSSDLVLVKTFVYASKLHVPDYYVDGSGNNFRIITDHLGSVRLLIAANSGRVIKLMEHDEFGRVLQDTRPGFLPFGFAGGIYDKDTKLVRFGVRDYDPEVGRWLSKDPIRFESSDTNLYGYVLQDPINLIDPTGKDGVGAIIAIGKIVVGAGAVVGGVVTAPATLGVGTAVSIGAVVGGACLLKSGYDSIGPEFSEMLSK